MLELRLLGDAAFADAGCRGRFSARPQTVPRPAWLLLDRRAAVARVTLATTLRRQAETERTRADLRRHVTCLSKALTPQAGQPWIAVDTRTLRWNVRARSDDALARYREPSLAGYDGAWFASERAIAFARRLLACVDAARWIAALARVCDGARVVATCGSRLDVPGERAYRIPSLDVSPRSALALPKRALAFGAVRLFVTRAAVNPNVALGPGDVAAGGTPFAIDPAARADACAPRALAREPSERTAPRGFASRTRGFLTTVRTVDGWRYRVPDAVRVCIASTRGPAADAEAGTKETRTAAVAAGSLGATGEARAPLDDVARLR